MKTGAFLVLSRNIFLYSEISTKCINTDVWSLAYDFTPPPCIIEIWHSGSMRNESQEVSNMASCFRLIHLRWTALATVRKTVLAYSLKVGFVEPRETAIARQHCVSAQQTQERGLLCEAWTFKGHVYEYSTQRRVLDYMLLARYSHLTKTKPIHKKQIPPSRQRGWDDSKGSVAIIYLVVILKKLGAKTNRLAVNHQS
jgi:hypothetical protein